MAQVGVRWSLEPLNMAANSRILTIFTSPVVIFMSQSDTANKSDRLSLQATCRTRTAVGGRSGYYEMAYTYSNRRVCGRKDQE